MRVLPLPAFNDNYIWLIINEEKNNAFCIDPGDAKPVIDFVTKHKLKLIAAVITHHHFDHVGGIQELIEFNPNIMIHGPEDARIPLLTHVLLGGSTQTIEQCHFNVLNTKGHTSTHISLYEPSLGWLFCGDTLFSAGCGRVFDGTLDDLHQSLQTFKKLPNNTHVFCAHEYTRQNLRFAAFVEPNNIQIQRYARELAKHNHCTLPSTIEFEKEINPFLRTEATDVIQYVSLKGNTKLDSLNIFKQLRKDKDNFKYS